MKLNNIKNIIINFSLISFIYSAIGINFIDNGDNSYKIYYSNPSYMISSFKFDVIGASVDSIYGGVINNYLFNTTINSESQTISVNNSGTLIQSGTAGIVIQMLLDGTPTGLNNIIILDESEDTISVDYKYYGCDNESACNYNSYISDDNGLNEQYCKFPCNIENGCLNTDENYIDNYQYFDCAGNCSHIDSCTGCMDDGYQQWSPYFGSPACNYNSSAIIEDDCLYNDCLGTCGGSASFDECGLCNGNNTTCLDCAGSPNGLAYINNFCKEFNLDGCIGGDTGYLDCVQFLFPDTLIYYINDIINYPIYVNNLDSLRSLEMEIHHDNKLEIIGFNRNNSNLSSVNYSLNYSNSVVGEDSIKTILSIFFEPSINSSEIYFSEFNSNIFNVEFNMLDLETNYITQFNINKLVINENEMHPTNWSVGTIAVEVLKGCTDDGYQQWSPTIGTPACNYNPDAIANDGSCWYSNIGCTCADNQGAVVDICGVCDGGIEDEDECTCANPDCYGNCPPLDGCPDDFSFQKGCAYIDECNICVGGLTEMEPCIEDCDGVLGGPAYEDACGNCITEEDIDCFNANFKIYDYSGIEIINDFISVSDTVIAAVYFENIPKLIEGIDININFNPELLSIIDWDLKSNNINDSLNIYNVLDIYYDCNACSIINDSTFSGSIYYTNPLNSSDFPEINTDGNILFFMISPLGMPDSIKTFFKYNYVIINENEMKEENYFSKELLLSIIEAENTVPHTYSLSQNYPNPFNPVTTIEYFVPRYEYIDIDIININGQIVNHLVSHFHHPGNYHIIWNGTDNNGLQLSSGIYFYNMFVSDYIFTKKLILLK